MKLKELYKTISERKRDLPEGSYTASLFNKGVDRIVQKVGEEAVEVVIAAKGKKKKEVIYEMADLWYHCLVLMVQLDVKLEDVLEELEKRKKG